MRNGPGLISQMRRAAVSIPSNVAEGAGRDSAKEFHHFLSISNGSSYELETQFLLAESFGYINASVVNVYSEVIGGSRKSALSQTEKIYDFTTEVLNKAELEGIHPQKQLIRRSEYKEVTGETLA